MFARRAIGQHHGRWRQTRLWAACALGWLVSMVEARSAPDTPSNATPCQGRPTLYLTIETGHMGVASSVVQILQQHGIVATFFLSNERTRNGGYSLDAEWAAWWRARAREGHAFASLTWDRWVWKRDEAVLEGEPHWVVRPSVGVDEGQRVVVDATAYCEALQRPADRFLSMTGHQMLPLFRAPEGRISPSLLAAAAACGWQHVPWSPDGDLGDEWPVAQASDAQLLNRALRNVAHGDVLRMRLGGGLRETVWSQGVLEPMILGFKARGYCFATLHEHPRYAAWLEQPFARP